MPEYLSLDGAKYNPIVPKLPVNEAPNLGLQSSWEPGYDDGYRQGMNQEWNRSSNQS